MPDFPDSAHFAAALEDQRFYAALLVAVLSGVVRGFSGFGSALMYIPLVSAIYEPRVAVVSFALIDFFCTLPLAVRAYPVSNRGEVWPLTIATGLTMPLGAMLLRYVEPVILRWFVAALVLGLLAVLISGWRYRGKPTVPLTIGIGLISGVTGGAVQLTGPFLIVYWLGSTYPAAIVRANLILFFGLTDAILCVVYYWQGLMAPEVIALALLVAVPYVLALGGGAFFFKGTSELLYRRIAYAIVAAAAIVSLPLFDGVLR